MHPSKNPCKVVKGQFQCYGTDCLAEHHDPFEVEQEHHDQGIALDLVGDIAYARCEELTQVIHKHHLEWAYGNCQQLLQGFPQLASHLRALLFLRQAGFFFRSPATKLVKSAK